MQQQSWRFITRHTVQDGSNKISVEVCVRLIDISLSYITYITKYVHSLCSVPKLYSKTALMKNVMTVSVFCITSCRILIGWFVDVVGTL